MVRCFLLPSIWFVLTFFCQLGIDEDIEYEDLYNSKDKSAQMKTIDSSLFLKQMKD